MTSTTLPMISADPFALMTAGAMALAAVIAGYAGYGKKRFDHAMFAIYAVVGIALLMIEGAPSLVENWVGDGLRRAVDGVSRLALALTLPGFLLVQYRLPYGLFWMGGTLIALASVGILIPQHFAASATALTLLITLVTGYVPMNEGEKGAAPLYVACLVAGIDFALSPVQFMDSDWLSYLQVILLLSILAYFAQRNAEREARARSLEAAARLEGELGAGEHSAFVRRWLVTIGDWVEGDPGVAAWFTQTAAQEVRTMVKLLNKPTAPLLKEVALCQRYLAILSKRQRQTISLEAEGADLEIPVPTGIIHPLIDLVLDIQQVRSETEMSIAVSREEDKVTIIFDSPLAPIMRAEVAEQAVDQALLHIRERIEAVDADWGGFHQTRDNLRWQCHMNFTVQERGAEETETAEA